MERMKMLVAAICESGVDDYRSIVKRFLKTKEFGPGDVKILRELDEDMPGWLYYMDLDGTWEDLKSVIRQQEMKKAGLTNNVSIRL